MSRLSRAYFPNAERPDDSPVFYAFMFIRDVHTGIMPFRRGREYPFTVTLHKRNQNLEMQLKEFLSIGQRAPWALDESLWQTTETLSHYLVALGETYLEIVYDDEKLGDGLNGKTLEFLPRGKIIKLFGNYVQIVPFRNWERGEKKFYAIPSDRIWHVKLPRKLGTPRRHRKMLKRLNKLSEPMPKFALKDGELGGSGKYDFMKHHYYKEIAVERTTAKWGSIPSLSQIKGTTEYYYIVNRLQATYSQALLREHIFAEINGLLKRLEIRNPIEVAGLATSTELLEAAKKLDRGEIGFSEALKITED